MRRTNLSAPGQQSARMKQILGIETEPVGVFLIGAEDDRDFSAFENVSGHRYCQLLMRARGGEAVLLKPEDFACPAAAAAFGFRELPAKLASGEGLVGFGIVETPATGKKMFDAMPRLTHGKIAAVAAAPLGKLDALPDVVVVEAQPEQLMWLLLADLNLSGGARRHGDTAVLRATCVDSTVIPHLDQRLNFSLGCYGCREATDLGSAETVLGFPGVLLDPLVKALEFLAARAIPRSRAKSAYEHLMKKVEQASGGTVPVGPRAQIGALPRLEGDMAISLNPDEVRKVFGAMLDSDRDAALDLVVNVLQRRSVPVWESGLKNNSRKWCLERRKQMKIKVLGTGCPKCKKLYAESEKAVASSGVSAEIEKVEKIEEIMKFGVMMTPALVIDDEVKASGRIAPASEIVTWITSAAAKENHQNNE